LDARAIAERWHEMIREGDERAFADLTTEDYIAHGPGGSGTPEDFLKWLRWYTSAFTDQRWQIHDLIASGDRIVVRYQVDSTYQGGFLDLPGRGQPVHEQGILILRVDENGRVAESWFEGNDLEIAQSLGGVITSSPV
jgi:predicted ester cyclase